MSGSMFKEGVRRSGVCAAAAVSALLLVSGASFTPVANAATLAQCSPLRIAGILPKNPRVIVENGKKVGVNVSFHVYVKNTNPKRTYYASTPVTVNMRARSTGTKTVHDGGRFNAVLRHEIAGGKSKMMTTQRMDIRKQGNRYNLMASVSGSVLNEHCKDVRKPHAISTSSFVYDLTPMLSGRPAKRVSGRYQGYSESSRPPIRPAGISGAPRPRG